MVLVILFPPIVLLQRRFLRRIVAQTAEFCVCDELPLRQLPLAIARQKSQDARETTKRHGVSSCVRLEGGLLSSWKCAGRWVFSAEHRSEAAAHHFGVFDTTILDGKIRRSRIVSVRDGSVLTSHKPRRDKLGSSPHHKITAIPLWRGLASTGLGTQSMKQAINAAMLAVIPVMSLTQQMQQPSRAPYRRFADQLDTLPGPSGRSGLAPKPSRPRVPEWSKRARSQRERAGGGAAL